MTKNYFKYKNHNLNKYIKELRLSNTKSYIFENRFKDKYNIAFKIIVKKEDYFKVYKILKNRIKRNNNRCIIGNRIFDINTYNINLYFLIKHKKVNDYKFYKRLYKCVKKLVYFNKKLNYRIEDYILNKTNINNLKIMKYLDKKIFYDIF